MLFFSLYFDDQWPSDYLKFNLSDNIVYIYTPQVSLL